MPAKLAMQDEIWVFVVENSADGHYRLDGDIRQDMQ